MIIDIHAHAFPDELAPRAMEVLIGNSGIAAFTDGTLAGLRASMRRAGVDRSVVAPIATKPGQATSVNRWAASVNQVFRDLSEAEIPKQPPQDLSEAEISKQPAREYGDVICLGSLHPLQDDWQSEIDGLVAAGIPGVKFHPDYQLFFVDDPVAIPIYRALADAGLFVLFHAGIDIGLPPPVHCTPDRLARVLEAVPNLTAIAAHMGGYKCWDEVEHHLVGRDLYFDTSYSFADLGTERMNAMIKAHGTQRIVFGTDSPWTDQSAEIANLRGLALTDEEKAMVLGGNAGRLLTA